MSNDCKKNRAISIIPARGGSKRVPMKNIKALGGRPLISFALQAALDCEWVHRVLVSTDNEKIAHIAKLYGADVPYLRPPELAGDEVPADLAILELISALKLDKTYPYVVINPPTSPFVKSAHISACLELLEDNPELDTMLTVSKLDHRHHPLNLGFPINELHWQFSDPKQRQKLKSRQSKPTFHKFCNLFVVRTEQILSGSRFGKKIGYLELPEIFSQDMDTELDFVIAEAILKEYGTDFLCEQRN